MSNYKRIPILINASDTTEYLTTKTNIAPTILQSSFKFLFWGSLHFGDQNKNSAKSQNRMPD